MRPTLGSIAPALLAVALASGCALDATADAVGEVEVLVDEPADVRARYVDDSGHEVLIRSQRDAGDPSRIIPRFLDVGRSLDVKLIGPRLVVTSDAEDDAVAALAVDDADRRAAIDLAGAAARALRDRGAIGDPDQLAALADVDRRATEPVSFAEPACSISDISLALSGSNLTGSTTVRCAELGSYDGFFMFYRFANNFWSQFWDWRLDEVFLDGSGVPLELVDPRDLGEDHELTTSVLCGAPGGRYHYELYFSISDSNSLGPVLDTAYARLSPRRCAR